MIKRCNSLTHPKWEAISPFFFSPTQTQTRFKVYRQYFFVAFVNGVLAPIGWTNFLKKLWRIPAPFPPIFAEKGKAGWPAPWYLRHVSAWPLRIA